MSAEDKLAAVLRYVNGKESTREVVADIEVSHRYLLTWVVFAISTAFLAYVGYTRRKNMIDKFAKLLGIILFIISVVLYFLK